jgi:transcriptional regulator with XRE-family HTH domain
MPTNETTSTIGDRIARLRARHRLTQEQLADRARVSVDTIRKLEQGQRQTARLATLNALARALDVEPSVLVGQPICRSAAGVGNDRGLCVPGVPGLETDEAT